MKLKMKKIVSMLALLCLVTVLFVLISSSESIHADTKELKSIEITKKPDKLVYETGEVFDPKGMVITAHYTDNTSAPIDDYFWDWTGSLYYNNTSIRIIYTEDYISKDVNLDITVNPELDRIEILTPPAKTVYEEGELFDHTGMVVQATYSNKTTEIITDYDIDFNGGLPTYGKVSKDVDIQISYTYGHKTIYTYQTVTVNRSEQRTLTGLYIDTPPSKTSYKEGENLILNGITLIATYDNGKSVQIQQFMAKVEGEQKDNLFTTDNRFTISYNEDGVTVSADQEITVNKSTFYLDSITITKAPLKTEYIEGQIFDPTGIELTAEYTDAPSRHLHRVSSIEPSGALKPDDKYVTLYYTENDITKSVQLDITVEKKTPTEILLVTAPDKLTYIEGQMFDPSGMVIKVKYNNESEEIVTNYDYTPKTALQMTDNLVHISYEMNGTTVYVDKSISVFNKQIVGIVIEKGPEKTEYIEGESFDESGMVVKANYDNGTTKTLDQTDYIVDSVICEYYNLSVDCTNVKIMYQENSIWVSADQPIKVKRKSPSSMVVTADPDQKEYIEEEVFNPNGMWITITYDNGTTAQIEGTDNRLSVSSQKLVTSDTGVKISYTENGKVVETTLNIKVNPKIPVSMAITKEPDKIEYLEGDSFDPTGMEVNVTYNNGTTAVVEGYTYSAAEPFETEGVPVGETVSIRYMENNVVVSENINVTINPKSVINILVTTPPNKTEYIAGENFDPTGMVVTALYNNGTSAVVENYTYSPDNSLETTCNEIDIEYSENNSKTVYAKQFIKVNPAPKVLKNIVIRKNPDKLEYTEGERFDPSGMEVLAVYEDDAENLITEYSFSPEGPMAEGYGAVQISYTEEGITKTTELDIMVNLSNEQKILERIEITTPPDKLDYFEGEQFDRRGMLLTLYYSDGTTYQKRGLGIGVEPEKLGITDTYVTVSCSDYFGNVKTATQPITVKAKVTFTGITITTPPAKTEYTEGDEFDTSGMIVTATYSDGSTKVVKKEDEYIAVSPLKNLKITDTYVTITYFDEDGTVKTATQPITVKVKSNNSGSVNNSGHGSGNSGSGSTYIPVSIPTPTPEVPGTTTKEVKNADGSKTTTTRTLEESGKVTETTVKESKNGDKSTTEVVTDGSGKIVSTIIETKTTNKSGTTTVSTTVKKADGSLSYSTVETYKSGKVVSKITETNADKSRKTVEETKQADGSTTKTVTKVSAGGSAKMTVTAETPAADDKEAKKTEFVYSMTESGKAKLVKVTTDEAEITIPATVTINGIKCKVVIVGKSAFKGNTSITKIVIGKYVETIGTKAFAGLKDLNEISISSSKLSKVSKSAFYKISKDAKFYIKAKKSACKSIAALITKSGVKKVNYERVK